MGHLAETDEPIMEASSAVEVQISPDQTRRYARGVI